MQKIIFITGIFTLFLSSYGSSTEKESTMQAMHQAVEKYSKNVQIQFETRTYWSAFEEWMASSGFLEVSGTKYRLKTVGMEWVSNGNVVWKYNEENSQVIISPADQEAMPSKVLLDFLRGKALSLQEVDSNYKVLLEPSGALQAYSRIEMLLSKETYLPKQIHTWDEEENQSVYIVKDFKYNVKFSGGHFIFPLSELTSGNADIEVIDTTED